jgi:hypothetical protein
MDQSEQHTDSGSSDSTVAVDQQPTAASDAASEAPTTNGNGHTDANGRPDPGRGFLGELALAMRGAAERERERITAEVDAATEAHIEKVRLRAATEAAELRRLAEEDIDGIHAWSKEETIRIREETDFKIGTRREELQSYLIRHAAIIDGEVGHVEGAVRDYRGELDQFFARLVAEEDPAAFAQLADEMPAPPDLSKVGGAARAEAVAALAEEFDASDAAVADAVASAEVNGMPGGASAFDPAQPGPELVPVMSTANGTANGTPVMADVVASGEPVAAEAEAEPVMAEAPEAVEAAVATEAAVADTSAQPNAAVRIWRSLASSLSPSEPAAVATPAAEAVAETPALEAPAAETDEPKA